MVKHRNQTDQHAGTSTDNIETLEDSSTVIEDDYSYKDIIELVLKYYGNEDCPECIDEEVDCGQFSDLECCNDAQQSRINCQTSTRSIQTLSRSTSNFGQSTFPYNQSVSQISLRILLGPSLDETAILILSNIELLYELYSLCQCHGSRFYEDIIPLLRSMFLECNSFVKLIIVSTIFMMILSPVVTVDQIMAM